jgi:hypothetical protein
LSVNVASNVSVSSWIISLKDNQYHITMDHTENRTIRDPSADTCFLGGSIDELPDPETVDEVSIEASSATQDENVSILPSASSAEVVDSLGSSPGFTRLKNPDKTGTMDQAFPTLPSGDEIDSKNTLQSFHIPVNSGRECDDRFVVTSTLSPSEINVTSKHPTLPSGEIIDSKNTLQSFNTRAAVLFRDIGPSDANNMNIPLSDLLPTAAAWIPPSQASDREVPPSETVYVAELVTQEETSRRKTTLVWVLFGTFALLGASLIAGVCFSGNCGSSDRKMLSPMTLRPTSSPMYFPAATPVDIPIEFVVTDFVDTIKFSDQEISVNGTSAESRALAWIVHDDPLFTDEALRTLSLRSDDAVSFRVRQRYSLAVLWFQQVDVKGLNVNPWNRTVNWRVGNECDWFGIRCLNGSVTDIQFFDYDNNVGNSFIGTIPPDIGLLTSLSRFAVRATESRNMILPENNTGTIPNAVPSKIPNNVIGTIPESISHCSQMSLFDIAGNSVIGTLPSVLGQWTDLLMFDVSQNKFTGNIPESIGNWSQVVTASFFSNDFTGIMPTEICANIQEEDTLYSDCNLNCACCSLCQ